MPLELFTIQQLHRFRQMCQTTILVLVAQFVLHHQSQAATLVGQLSLEDINSEANSINSPFAVRLTGFAVNEIGAQRNQLTDENGRFEVELSPGQWLLNVDLIGLNHSNLIFPSPFISITNPDDTVEITLKGLETSKQIRGSVKSDNGLPIPNLFVFAHATHESERYNVGVRTDIQGGFKLAVFPGDWTLSISTTSLNIGRIPDKLVKVVEDTEVEFVATALPNTLTITPESLRPGFAGRSYRTTQKITEAETFVNWHSAPGTELPPGLSLDPNSGELSGTPTQGGTFDFTVIVTERFGQRTGTKGFSLTINADEHPPTLVTALPDQQSSPVRADSILAIQFNEPMRRFEAGEIPSIDWTWRNEGNTRSLEPSEFEYRWNSNSDRLFIVPKAPLPLGTHEWKLNPTSVTTSTDVRTTIQDAAGLDLRPTIARRFLVTEPIPSPRPPTSEPSRNRAIKEIWILKNKDYNVEFSLSGVLPSRFFAVANVEEGVWNPIVEASFRTPKAETHAIPLSESINNGSLEFSEFSTEISPLFDDYPSGSYQVTVNTTRSETLSATVRLEDPSYPGQAVILNPCELDHVIPSLPFWLQIEREESETPQPLELFIANTPTFDRVFLPPTANVVFRQVLGGDEDEFEIPAGTLDPSRRYWATVRQYRIKDESDMIPGVPVRSAYTSTTRFQISTRATSIVCNQLISGELLISRPGTPSVTNRSLSRGQSLPPIASVRNDSDQAAILQTGRSSQIQISPTTVVQIDLSGTRENAIRLTLQEGSLTIEGNAEDTRRVPFMVSTPGGTVKTEVGRSIILHDSESNVSSLTVFSGVASLMSDDPTLPSESILAGNGKQFSPSLPLPDNDPPELTITRRTDGGLTLLWNSEYSDWRPVARTELSETPRWRPIPHPPTAEGNQLKLQIEPSFDSGFFRLEKNPISTTP